MSNSNYNKIGYIEIPTDNIEETKNFIRICLVGNMRKVKTKKEEKKTLVNKKCWSEGSNNLKRENNQTPTFYIMVESIDDFIAKSQKQGAKVVVNNRKYLKAFMLQYKISNKIHLVYGKAKIITELKII